MKPSQKWGSKLMCVMTPTRWIVSREGNTQPSRPGQQSSAHLLGLQRLNGEGATFGRSGSREAERDQPIPKDLSTCSLMEKSKAVLHRSYCCP